MSIIHSNLLKDANGRQNETIERQLVRQFETNEAQQFDLAQLKEANMRQNETNEAQQAKIEWLIEAVTSSTAGRVANTGAAAQSDDTGARKVPEYHLF